MRAVLIVLAVVGALAQPAAAERRRVAVLSFTGPNAERIRGEVLQIVGKSHTIVSPDSWARTARSLAATKPTTANVAKVARKLDVDAVVDATVERARTGFRVRLRLREGATGKTIERTSVETSGTRLGKAARREIRNEVVDVISSLDRINARAASRKSKR